MWHRLIFFSVFLTCWYADAFHLPFRPVEQFRYRSGACEADLERVTYALLKEKTYTGCLETALAALDQKGSALSRQFERTYSTKYGRVQMNYDPLLKRVLRREILKRLGREDASSSFLTQPLRSSVEAEENFIQALNRFCRHNKEMGNSYAQERVNRIVYGIKTLDVTALFEGFRKTWLVAESLEDKDPQVLKGMKQLRNRFLVVLNQMILLKKALAGKSTVESGELEELMYKVVLRTEWINAYHLLKSHAMMSDTCLEDKAVCTRAFEEMDVLASIVQSFDDLKTLCGTKRQPLHHAL